MHINIYEYLKSIRKNKFFFFFKEKEVSLNKNFSKVKNFLKEYKREKKNFFRI
jgi:hypothetical protein